MTTAEETVPQLMINAVTGESHTIQLLPMAGLPVADVKAFLAGRRAEGLTIDPENCAAIKYYVDPRDIYDLFDLGEDICTSNELFVRNLPDGYWGWDGDLPEDTLKKLWERFERATKEPIR